MSGDLLDTQIGRDLADWFSDHGHSGRTTCRRAQLDLAHRDERIFSLEGDLGLPAVPFPDELPDQYRQIGIAEANLMGVAAGMAMREIKPFVNTFATFATMRACEQMRLDIAYHASNVKVVGYYAGISGGWAGPSHDRALRRGHAHQLAQLLAGAEFWFLAFSFAGCGVNMAFIDVHLVPLMQDRSADPAAVASTLTALGVFEIIGGFAVAALAVRSPFRVLLSSLYLVRGLSVFLLVAAGSQLAYVTFGAIFGLTYLGTVIITSLYCVRFYGKEVKGTVFGALWFGHQLGGVACVSLGALAYDLQGDYYAVVWATGAISLVSALLALTMPARISAGRQR